MQAMMVMNHGLNGNSSDTRVLKKDKGTFLSFNHINSSCSSDFVADLEPLMVKDSDNAVNYRNGSGINRRNNADKIDAQNMFDEMSLNKFLTKYGTVKEYFDSFNSWFSKMTLEEWYRVDLFICGLPLEFGNGNSNQPLLDSSKSKDSKEMVKNNMRLRDFDDSSKEDVKGKEKYSNGLIFDECGKDKESSVKGNKMFPNESVDSDTVDSEFMVMEVDEFQDCVNGGEMDYVFEGNIGRLADEHERNFRGNSNGLPDTKWKNVGKGKCNKLVENKDEYDGEQDGSKEDNDLIVCDLVLRKCYDGWYFEDQ
ncbi:hypothetical protein Tco_0962649, partial [Tanacetum coccineum]